MKALVARSPLGLFAFSENGELLYYKLWTGKNVVDRFNSPLDSDFLSNLSGYEIAENNDAYTLLRRHFREYARDLCGLDGEKLNLLLCEFSTALSKSRLRGSVGRDRVLIQAVRSLDDLTRSINVFEERLYEWYSLHYPEIRNANLVDTILKHGRRENVPGFKSSTGADISDEDESALRAFASLIKTMGEQKKSIENYIEGAMKEIAVNTSSIIDPLLAARLLGAAGSLEKLARMPASTIQLLGAEKALFRHLQKKGRSPKYGLLYNSHLIQVASEEKRGKIARILSAKLMMAARIDYYSGRNDSEKLVAEMKEEIRRLQ